MNLNWSSKHLQDKALSSISFLPASLYSCHFLFLALLLVVQQMSDLRMLLWHQRFMGLICPVNWTLYFSLAPGDGKPTDHCGCNKMVRSETKVAGRNEKAGLCSCCGLPSTSKIAMRSLETQIKPDSVRHMHKHKAACYPRVYLPVPLHAGRSVTLRGSAASWSEQWYAVASLMWECQGLADCYSRSCLLVGKMTTDLPSLKQKPNGIKRNRT